MKTMQQVNQKMDFSEDSVYVGIDVHKKPFMILVIGPIFKQRYFVSHNLDLWNRRKALFTF